MGAEAIRTAPNQNLQKLQARQPRESPASNRPPAHLISIQSCNGNECGGESYYIETQSMRHQGWFNAQRADLQSPCPSYKSEPPSTVQVSPEETCTSQVETKTAHAQCIGTLSFYLEPTTCSQNRLRQFNQKVDVLKKRCSLTLDVDAQATPLRQSLQITGDHTRYRVTLRITGVPHQAERRLRVGG